MSIQSVGPNEWLDAASDGSPRDAVKLYLREIACHDRLTADEEVALAQRLESGETARVEIAEAADSLAADRRSALEHLIEEASGRLGASSSATCGLLSPSRVTT